MGLWKTSSAIGFRSRSLASHRPFPPSLAAFFSSAPAAATALAGSAGGCALPVARGAGVIGFGEAAAAR